MNILSMISRAWRPPARLRTRRDGAPGSPSPAWTCRRWPCQAGRAGVLALMLAGSAVAQGGGRYSKPEAELAASPPAPSLSAEASPGPTQDPAPSRLGVTLLDLLVAHEADERQGSFRGCLSSSWQSSFSLDEQTTADSHFRLAGLYLEQANYYSHKAHEREERLTLARQHGAPQGLAGLAAQQTEQAENMRRWMHQALKKYIELASVPLYRTDPRRDQVLATAAALLSLLNKPAQVQHFWSLLLQEYPRSPYVAIGHLALGESYFKNQDYPRSLQFYQEALRGGSGPVSRYALYRIGHVQVALGDLPAALATFSRVIAAADGP